MANMDSKLVKIVVLGALGENGRINAGAQETIALYMDPLEQAARTFIVNATLKRFDWLEFVPRDQWKIYWIDAENDRISIYTDSDMDICLDHGGPIPRVYIQIGPAAGESSAAAAEPSATAATAHSATAAPANGGNVLHPNVVCDSCEGEVRGIRYKCAQCVDFDLCASCESQGKHSMHLMYRMADPMADIGAQIERRLQKWLRKHMPRDADASTAANHTDSGDSGDVAAEAAAAAGCGAAANSRAGHHQHHQLRRHAKRHGCPMMVYGTPARGTYTARASEPATSAPKAASQGGQRPAFEARAEPTCPAATMLGRSLMMLDPFMKIASEAASAAVSAASKHAAEAAAAAPADGAAVPPPFPFAAASAAQAAEVAAKHASMAAEVVAKMFGQQRAEDAPKPAAAAPAAAETQVHESNAAGAESAADDESVHSNESGDSVLEALMKSTDKQRKDKRDDDGESKSNGRTKFPEID